MLTGCSTEDPEVVETTAAADAYANDYYYAADLAASDVYWTDQWVHDPYAYYSSSAPSQQPSPPPGTRLSLSVGALIRGLARGESGCEGRAMVTERTVADPCGKEGATIRVGATIEFNGCALEGGGTLEGSLDVSSVHTAGNCEDGAIDVTYTSTYSNLTYVAPSGARVRLPSLTNTGSYMLAAQRALGALSVQTEGLVQHFSAEDEAKVEYSYTGAWEYEFSSASAKPTYIVNGTLTIEDIKNGQTSTATSQGLTRVSDCCQPTAGEVVIAGTDRDTAKWTFGPECGAILKDGMAVQPPDCL